jgi:copper chaperone CopZ
MAERNLAIEVEGMSCGGCVSSVTRVLSRLPGVRVLGVEVGSAKVAVEESTGERELTGAIEKAGFTARSIRPI